jgi:hypothetical protein
MDENNDKRQHPRYPVRIKVRFRVISDSAPGEWREVVLMTAGKGGAFLSTELELALGTDIEMELPILGAARQIIAKVRWLSREEPRGIGVMFTAIPHLMQNLILDEIFGGRWLEDKTGSAAENAKKQTGLFMEDLSRFLDDKG